MLPFSTLPDSAYLLIWAAVAMIGTALLLAGYRKWQSESATVVLTSKEYKEDRKALVEEFRTIMVDEGHRTRELLTERIDSLGRSLDRVERNAATKADCADLRGKIRTLQELNQVLHGVRASDSGAMRVAS